MSNAFVELSADNLSDVMATSRVRGLYRENADNFLEAGIPGAEINLKDGPFKGKKVASVKQGFATLAAKDEYKDRLRVVGTEDRVVLINKQAA
jgi:hypothetical protein